MYSTQDRFDGNLKACMKSCVSRHPSFSRLFFTGLVCINKRYGIKSLLSVHNYSSIVVKDSSFINRIHVKSNVCEITEWYGYRARFFFSPSNS